MNVTRLRLAFHRVFHFFARAVTLLYIAGAIGFALAGSADAILQLGWSLGWATAAAGVFMTLIGLGFYKLFGLSSRFVEKLIVSTADGAPPRENDAER